MDSTHTPAPWALTSLFRNSAKGGEWWGIWRRPDSKNAVIHQSVAPSTYTQDEAKAKADGKVVTW